MKKPAKLCHNSIEFLRGIWDEEDVFVVGTGSSLADFDWGRLRYRRVIALNDAALVPGIGSYVHLFSDVNIWKRYQGKDYDPAFIVCQQIGADFMAKLHGGALRPRLRVFRQVIQAQMDRMDGESGVLHTGRTVANAGVLLAWLMGARRIFLLGVDAYRTQDLYYHDRPEHAHGTKLDVMWQSRDGRLASDVRHQKWINGQREVSRFLATRFPTEGWPGRGVYNLSPLSRVDAWDKVDPSEVFGEECVT